MSKLVQSLAPGGVHYRLAQLAGTWAGTARTWFEPDKLADTSPITGTIRPVLDGRFVVHEYRSSLQGKPLTGMAIHGYHIDLDRYETAWIDSFHCGTSIMFSHGERRPGDDGDAPLSVLGHYVVPGSEPWGWRTTLEMPDPDHLVLTHYNIIPGGGEARAVEIQYTRQPDAS
jgi:hypothetical protein